MDDRLQHLIQLIRSGKASEAEALVEDMRSCQETLKSLQSRTQQLEEAERMRTEFLALISHELRTPLNAIIGYNSLLDDGVYGDMNEKQHKAVQRIDRNAARLLSLINQLLELNRLESGAASVFYEETDLKKIVDAVLDDYQVVAEEKGVEFITAYPRRDVYVISDPAKLGEMIRQLVSNAVKFTQKGTIQLKIHPRETHVTLEVADTGSGIDESKREKIFCLFEQAEPMVARPCQGAGLGLAIVRRVADLLKICVELESRIGEGSTFRLNIPVKKEQVKPAAQVEEKTAPQPTEPESETKPYEAGKAGSVLIVDDDPYMVEVLSDFLENRGHYHVDKAYSGMHAMLKLTEHKPDFLFVDLLMPNIKGERVIEYCTQLWRRSVKIVVITGKKLSSEERDALLQSGASDILLKGDLQQGFAETIEAIIPIPSTV
ncbi:MAG: hybrid sensor histidine kinase/response regulator [Candidatus Hinthialibacter antarcticus]|nr:hybrid sensor histidine kinase/response regulator [Candidatus Hinthialibacter antarcticus]